jgi:NAD(P)-dependent dehydrogenase (short-subunit alcohol dehydrogenase family)
MSPGSQALQGRHAFVTGASRGIGAAIARALAAQGATLTLAARDEASLKQLAHELSAITTVGRVSLDITQLDSVQAGVERAAAERGAIHVLVNNAGQAHSAPFAKTDLALWSQMLAVNLTGTYLCTHAVLPHMLAAAQAGTPGRIIHIASTAALQGYAYVSAYTAAKHGVLGLTRSLALELAGKNITVNAICPGYTETDIVKDAVANIMAKTGKSESEARAALAARNPQGRLIQPEEIAQAVCWLCQPGSASVNGQAIAIDGGESIT